MTCSLWTDKVVHYVPGGVGNRYISVFYIIIFAIGGALTNVAFIYENKRTVVDGREKRRFYARPGSRERWIIENVRYVRFDFLFVLCMNRSFQNFG